MCTLAVTFCFSVIPQQTPQCSCQRIGVAALQRGSTYFPLPLSSTIIPIDRCHLRAGLGQFLRALRVIGFLFGRARTSESLQYSNKHLLITLGAERALAA